MSAQGLLRGDRVALEPKYNGLVGNYTDSVVTACFAEATCEHHCYCRRIPCQ